MNARLILVEKKVEQIGKKSSKLGCVVRMVVDSILPYAESGPKDHRKDAPLFITLYQGCKMGSKSNCFI